MSSKSKLSRRFFLRGTGATLALPLLPSLLPRGAQAAVGDPPVRYLQVISDYSPTAVNYYASLKATQRISPHVNVAPLSSFTGPLSPVLGNSFNALKSKVSVLRGFDILGYSSNHNFSMPTCGTGYMAGGTIPDGEDKMPATGQESIDVILSKSSKIYGADVAANRRLILMNPLTTDNYSIQRTFSWSKSGGKLAMLRPTKQTQGFFDAFASGFASATGQVGPDPQDLSVVNAVFGEYQSLREGGRLSSEDKRRLEAYMSLVRDIEVDLQASGTSSCQAPSRDAEPNADAMIRNQFRFIAAAMACDLTRVASITLGMNAGYDARHPEHHAPTNAPNLTVDLTVNASRIALLCSMLDGLVESNGTLLDNSVVYAAYQYCCPLGGDSHAQQDMPILLAGGAGGRLKQGNYVDYRLEGGGAERRPGLPLNNLLVTLFNTMGLGSSDYESVAGEGFGGTNWNSKMDFNTRPNASQWSTAQGRRTPVPFLYQGPTLG